MLTKKPKEIKPDLKVFYQGSISFVEPLSPNGRNWINANVSKEGYQPYWPTLIIDHRYLDNLLEGATNDGLIIIGPQRGGIVPSNVNLWDMLKGSGFPQD